MTRSIPHSRLFQCFAMDAQTPKRKGKTMCHYCDVRMPDGCGFELDSKRKDFELMLCPNGNTRVIYDDCKGNVYRDDFYFNYCPMCGKKLGESDDENVKWLVEVDGDLLWFNKKQNAIERCEGEAENGHLANLYRIRIENKRTCQRVAMPVWE